MKKQFQKINLLMFAQLVFCIANNQLKKIEILLINFNN